MLLMNRFMSNEHVPTNPVYHTSCIQINHSNLRIEDMQAPEQTVYNLLQQAYIRDKLLNLTSPTPLHWNISLISYL